MSAFSTSKSPVAASLFAATLVAGGLGLGGCEQTSAGQATSVSAPASASTMPPLPAAGDPPATAPPRPAPLAAGPLQQLVAPIALYPDPLVAQMLAGSTYPDQLVEANQWRIRNASLKPADMAAAAEVQRWDVSVKSLTEFSTALAQLADNPSWAHALGDAYLNDPADVMAAIQQLRYQASARGNLKSSAQLRVVTVSTPAGRYDTPPPGSSGAPLYEGIPGIATAPPIITIMPAEADVVYVPRYDPQVVYGVPLRPYPGYSMRAPVAIGFGNGNGVLITAGVLTFGAGILVGPALLQERADHWREWNMHWGGRQGYDLRDRDEARPGVFYNHAPYATRSTTIINRIADGTVTNTPMTSNTVTSRTANTNTVTRNTVNSNTVNSNTVNSNTVNSNTVNSNTVNSNTVDNHYGNRGSSYGAVTNSAGVGVGNGNTVSASPSPARLAAPQPLSRPLSQPFLQPLLQPSQQPLPQPLPQDRGRDRPGRHQRQGEQRPRPFPRDMSGESSVASVAQRPARLVEQPGGRGSRREDRAHLEHREGLGHREHVEYREHAGRSHEARHLEERR